MSKIDTTNFEYYTIAFYNLENLFDTFDNKWTNDNDFLPNSEKRWTEKRYRKKLRKLGYAISQIGIKTAQKAPSILGVAEIENKLVLEDLLNSKFLKNLPYDYVHYDSPDERGIDVGLIYDTTVFEVTTSEVYPLELYDEDGYRDYTRDILVVEGVFNNSETLYILVNHWPSRHEGEELTEPNRLSAAKKVIEIINTIKYENENAKIIVMGDFNDGPQNNSIKHLVHNTDIYNPMFTLKDHNRGSLNYRKDWFLFDQILFTTNFFEIKPSALSFSQAHIFDSEFLKQYKGKFQGAPFRTYVGLKYKGGYSDHFPVYVHLRQSL